MNQVLRQKLINLTFRTTEKWGAVAQTYMAAEECIELAHACMKMNRSKGNRIDKRIAIINEMADVIIMIEQLQTTYSITDEEVGHVIKHKIERTFKRLEEEKS